MDARGVHAYILEYLHVVISTARAGIRDTYVPTGICDCGVHTDRTLVQVKIFALWTIRSEIISDTRTAVGTPTGTKFSRTRDTIIIFLKKKSSHFYLILTIVYRLLMRVKRILFKEKAMRIWIPKYQ